MLDEPGVTVLNEDYNAVGHMNIDALIDGNFKTWMTTDNLVDNYSGSKEFIIVLPNQRTIVSAFFQNEVFFFPSNTVHLGSYMGDSGIYVGTDQSYMNVNLQKCTSAFYDTGFQLFTTPCTGNVISLRRNGYGGGTLR